MSDEMAAVSAEEFFSEPDAPEAEPSEEPTPEPPQEDKPDPAAALAEKEAELKRKEAALNDWNMKLKEKEKSFTPQTKTEEPEGDLPPLSDEAVKVLDSWFQEKYGQKLSAVDVLFQDTIETELEAFAASKGIEPEALRDTLNEAGITPREFSRKGLREAFGTAYDIHRARTVDLDAEKAKWQEEFLAKLKEQGVRVDSIEPSGRVDMDNDASDVMDDDDMTPADRYRLITAKLKRKGA